MSELREGLLDDVIKHHGVKGMKWGIRRYQPYRSGDGQKGIGKFLGKEARAQRKADRTKVNLTVTDKEGRASTYTLQNRKAAQKFIDQAKSQGYKTEVKDVPKKDKLSANKAKKTIKSLKREYDFGKKGKESNLKKLSPSELKSITNRLRQENDLKRLSVSKEDKKAYKNRASLSSKQLQERVERLQLEDNLRQQAKLATKQQRALGKEVVNNAVNVGLKAYTEGVSSAAMAASDALVSSKNAYDSGNSNTKISDKEVQKAVSKLLSSKK